MLSRFFFPAIIVIAATPVVADETAKASSAASHADAKVIAFSAVTAIWLKPDEDKVAKLLDSKARDSDGPGAAIRALKEFREVGVEFFKNTSVTEIIFFTDADLPKLQQRFPKNAIWDAGRVPAHLKERLGCLVVWRELPGSKQSPDQVHLTVMIFAQSEDGHKIIYVDD